MEAQIEKRIKTVLAAVFNILVQDINDDMSTETLTNWDSLRHMNVVVALEEEFSIRFDEVDIGKMMNYATVKETIKFKLKS